MKRSMPCISDVYIVIEERRNHMQHWNTFHQDNNFAPLRLCAEKSEILCMLKKTMGENP